jgi:hypothetical protein
MDHQLKLPTVRILKVHKELGKRLPYVDVSAEVEGMTGRWLNQHFKTFTEIPNVDVFLCDMIASCVEYNRGTNSSELVFPPVDKWEYVENSSRISSAGVNYGILLALGADSVVLEGIRTLMYDNFGVKFVDGQPMSDHYCLGGSIGAMFSIMRYEGDWVTSDFCDSFTSIIDEMINPVDTTGVKMRSLILANIMEKNPDLEFPKLNFFYRKFC